jgi:hypothetical protein
MVAMHKMLLHTLPPLTVPSFFAIDDARSKWGFDKRGIWLKRGLERCLVLPVLHAPRDTFNGTTFF